MKRLSKLFTSGVCIAAGTGLAAMVFANTGAEAQTAPAAHAAGEHAQWGYTGSNGPDHWAEVSEAYGACSAGTQQSPVDLRGAIPASVGALAIKWKPMPIRVTNNGHTVQYDAPAGSMFAMMGNQYSLAQFHLHHPSEHLLNGERFPLEIHFVHKMPDGRIGVIGVFVKEGAANPTLQKLLDSMPANAGGTNNGAQFDPNTLLPKGRSFDRYEGSLTTPPCTEAVDWVVLRTPISASPAQVQQFAKLFPNNARPVQPLNRRFLLESR